MDLVSVVSADKWLLNEKVPSSEEWTKLVRIIIKDVPVDGYNYKKIGSLLSSFCDIQTISYDVVNNLHYVTGFVQSIEAIPKFGCLKLKYQTTNGVLLKLFAVKFEACLLNDLQGNSNIEDEGS